MHHHESSAHIGRRKGVFNRGASNFAGSPASVFYGDPVQIDQQVSAAVAEPSLSTAALQAAVVSPKSATNVEERAGAFQTMTQTGQADVVVVPALLVSNATLTKNPTAKGIPATVLNYNYLRCLTDFASAGLVKAGNHTTAPSTTLTIQLTQLDNPDEAPNDGVKSIPIFKFIIAASVLNARPGSYYSIYCSGVDVVGNQFTGENLIYSFSRVDYVQAISGYMIPFRIISARTVPVLAMYGGTVNPATFNIVITGLSADEFVTVIVPGYSVSETRDIAELYALPAGALVR